MLSDLPPCFYLSFHPKCDTNHPKNTQIRLVMCMDSVDFGSSSGSRSEMPRLNGSLKATTGFTWENVPKPRVNSSSKQYINHFNSGLGNLRIFPDGWIKTAGNSYSPLPIFETHFGRILPIQQPGQIHLSAIGSQPPFSPPLFWPHLNCSKRFTNISYHVIWASSLPRSAGRAATRRLAWATTVCLTSPMIQRPRRSVPP